MDPIRVRALPGKDRQDKSQVGRLLLCSLAGWRQTNSTALCEVLRCWLLR